MNVGMLSSHVLVIHCRSQQLIAVEIIDAFTHDDFSWMRVSTTMSVRILHRDVANNLNIFPKRLGYILLNSCDNFSFSCSYVRQYSFVFLDVCFQ
jgi:hypothetical protein